MIESGGRRLLLFDPPQMIQSGASGLISPDVAVAALCLLLLVLPRLIMSRALHGPLSASLNPHGLVRLSVSLHHHGFVGHYGRRGCISVGAPCRVGYCLAPPSVPWLFACGARCLVLRHPAAIVAWQRVLCRSCRRQHAYLACLLATHLCAALRPVRSLSVRGLVVPLPWWLRQPRAWLVPPDLLGSCRELECGASCCVVVCLIVLCCVVLCCVVLCCVVLCCVVLCCVVLCCVVLCCVVG